MTSPADIAALISAVGVILSGVIGYGVSSFKIGRWEGSQQAKIDQLVVDVNKIKEWDFAKLSADVSEIKGAFVLRPRP